MINSQVDTTITQNNTWEEMCLKLSQDKDLSVLVKKIGPCTLGAPNLEDQPCVSKDVLFKHLIRTIVGQQLHVKAAAKIQSKLESSIPHITPSSVLKIGSDQLREVGLSHAKIRSVKEISEAFLKDSFWNKDVIKADADTWEKELLRLCGVGPWSKDIILLEALHLPDIIPYHDFGLRKAWQNLKHLDEPPSPESLRMATLKYAPFRSLLSWYLWESLSLV